MRTAKFTRCHFRGNKAKYAAAVRVSDIGAADFEDCTFIGNEATGKGGAIVTQIENPAKNHVRIKNTLFCFNDAPEGKHIYNFRTLHECDGCQFNSKSCCSDNGRVKGAACICDAGWAGERCDVK